VMNRGRRSEEIFTESKDYDLFLELLKESSELFNIKIAAYCMMPNPYHLLLQTPDGNLSRCMRQINGVKQRLSKDRKFRDRVKLLSENLTKGQAET